MAPKLWGRTDNNPRSTGRSVWSRGRARDGVQILRGRALQGRRAGHTRRKADRAGTPGAVPSLQAQVPGGRLVPCSTKSSDRRQHAINAASTSQGSPARRASPPTVADLDAGLTTPVRAARRGPFGGGATQRTRKVGPATTGGVTGPTSIHGATTVPNTRGLRAKSPRDGATSPQPECATPGPGAAREQRLRTPSSGPRPRRSRYASGWPSRYRPGAAHGRRSRIDPRLSSQSWRRTLTTLPRIWAWSPGIGSYVELWGMSHTWPSCRRSCLTVASSSRSAATTSP